jgi:hypothetical protein
MQRSERRGSVAHEGGGGSSSASAYSGTRFVVEPKLDGERQQASVVSGTEGAGGGGGGGRGWRGCPLSFLAELAV